MNAAEPVELSLAKYEAFQATQVEVSSKQVEDLAHFIEQRLLKASGRLSRTEALAHHLFDELMVDAMVGYEHLYRMALTDPQESGIQIQGIARGVIGKIADDYFEDFADEARELGWIE